VGANQRTAADHLRGRAPAAIWITIACFLLTDFAWSVEESHDDLESSGCDTAALTVGFRGRFGYFDLNPASTGKVTPVM
jgi:hypothetical protein